MDSDSFEELDERTARAIKYCAQCIESVMENDDEDDDYFTHDQKLEITSKSMILLTLLNKNSKSGFQEAVEFLKDSIKQLKSIIGASRIKEPRACAILSMYYSNLASIYIEKLEDLHSGEKYALRCLETLSHYKGGRKPFYVITCLLNLGKLWMKRNDVEKAVAFFEQAESTYEACDLKDAHISKELKNLHINTLLQLKDVYQSREQYYRGAVYHHKFLKQFLKNVDDVGFRNDFLSFINDILGMAILYQRESLSASRHHLAVAKFLAEKFRKTQLSSGDQEIFEKAEALIFFCTGLYYFRLLQCIKDSKLVPDSRVGKIEDLRFEDFVEDVKIFENSITDKFVTNGAEAEDVLNKTLQLFRKAESHFTLKNHPRKFVEINKFISQAHKFAAVFKSNKEERVHCFERRVAMLKNLEAEIQKKDPDFWAFFVTELGEAYFALLAVEFEGVFDLKKISYSSDRMRKVYKLAKLTQDVFEDKMVFFKSYSNHIGDSVSQDFINCVISAHLHSLALQNMKHVMGIWNFMSKYAEQKLRVKDVLVTEFEECKKRMKTLSEQIARLPETSVCISYY